MSEEIRSGGNSPRLQYCAAEFIRCTNGVSPTYSDSFPASPLLDGAGKARASSEGRGSVVLEGGRAAAEA
jgi:hypothetical protein